MINEIFFPERRVAGSLRRSLSIQARVVWALVLREILTRYGRHNIGFSWLFVEPMMFTAGVTILWSFLHATFALPVIAFTVTGYSTILLWRNGVNRCALAIEPNRNLLFHRNVKVIDFFFSRLVLEISGATVSFVVIAGTLMFMGLMAPPADILLMLCGWSMLAWFCLGLGLMVGAMSEYSEAIDRLWHTCTYLMLPFSGLFYMVEWLPTYLHEWAMWVPMINASEMIRGGYFGELVTPHYDIGNFALVNLVLTFLGLIMVRGAAKRVEGA